MSSTQTCTKTTKTLSVVHESPRKIPLTALTLLTVPEEPMMETYLREKEAIDIRTIKSMAVDGFDSTVNFTEVGFATSDQSREKLVPLHSREYLQSLELSLDKFMALVTATEVHDAVLKTIGTSRLNSVFAPPKSRNDSRYIDS